MDRAAFTKIIDDLGTQAQQRTFAIVDEELRKLEATAVELWPVRKRAGAVEQSPYPGYSRDSIGVEYSASPTKGLRESLVVKAPYAYYVRSTKLRKNAAQALILGPLKELAFRLEARIRAEVPR
jgi:hypothetical protein